MAHTKKRLTLRPLELHDYENWRQAYSTMHAPQSEWDETNWDESELTPAKFKKYLKALEVDCKNDQRYGFGVFLRDDGVLVGLIELMNVSRGIFQNAYLGYRIFNPYWGKGFATEACRQALEIAFKDLKLHRVEAGIEPHNTISVKVAKAIGMRKEGLSQKRLLVDGKYWRDILIFAATCEDLGRKFKR